ncbi:MAG: DUF624 domain-containing protein [Eubacterium sp.]|nr:DUF624 domain-containing protein [Eubacterium sp.]
MLNKIFDLNNSFFQTVSKIGYIWWMTILWLVTSIPIVTIGASTTALIYTAMKYRHDEGYVTKNFFKSFKENFKQSTLIWLIYLIVGFLIGIGMIFWNNYDAPFSRVGYGVVIAVGIIYIISILYVFAIQSKFYNKIMDTIKYSVIMAFTNIKETFLMLLIIAGLVLINIFTNALVNFITLNFGMGLVTYLLGHHYERIFDKYIPEDLKADYSLDPDYVDIDVDKHLEEIIENYQ